MTHTVQHDTDRSRKDEDAPSTLIAFVKRFPTEDACEAYIIALRWPDGFACPKCGSTQMHKMASRRRTWACHRAHQTSITAGTILQDSRQPLTTWFYGAYLVSTLTPGISALQFQKQLGITRYETAFQMLHKLRAAMVAPGREKLRGEVEVDEAFVGGVEHGGKRGRGTSNKALIVVAVEAVHWDAPDPTRPNDRNAAIEKVRAGRLRMSMIPAASASVLVPWVEKHVEKGATVRTDGLKSYGGLTEAGYVHDTVLQKFRGKPTGRYLPLVHLLISNLKRWLLGTHKGAVSRKHLQAYLNEFTFRFNRRFWRGPAFTRALGLATHAESWPTYDALYAAPSDEGRWRHPQRQGSQAVQDASDRPTIDLELLLAVIDAERELHDSGIEPALDLDRLLALVETEQRAKR